MIKIMYFDLVKRKSGIPWTIRPTMKSFIARSTAFLVAMALLETLWESSKAFLESYFHLRKMLLPRKYAYFFIYNKFKKMSIWLNIFQAIRLLPCMWVQVQLQLWTRKMAWQHRQGLCHSKENGWLQEEMLQHNLRRSWAANKWHLWTSSGGKKYLHD